MTTEQIYALVNEVNSQAFGETSLAVADTSALISLGDTVLSTSSNTEAFLNTLAQRIGRTILRFREYQNKLGDMVLNDFEYGAILQKIKVVMPEAEADEMYDLVDGQSVDHYKIAKPDVKQKLFVTRTPFQFHITIQRETLKEAFMSPDAMGSFIGIIFGEVRNALEASLENLSRVTIATSIAEVAGSAREIKLVTEYNNETGESLTPVTALHSPEFMAYSVAIINTMRDSFNDMSKLHNDGSVATFTPDSDIRLRIISKFLRRLETVVQYKAFHEELVKAKGVVSSLNFWQAEENPYDVYIKRPSDSVATAVENVIGVMNDRDAMGVYKKDEVVATSPVNAAGLYYNTYWHEKDLRFLDLSENITIFTLN